LRGANPPKMPSVVCALVIGDANRKQTTAPNEHQLVESGY